MRIPESIFINPKAPERVYHREPAYLSDMVEYVPKERLESVEKKLEDILEERRKEYLTRREFYPRG